MLLTAKAKGRVGLRGSNLLINACDMCDLDHTFFSFFNMAFI
jgi:hypothetical protein